MSNWKSETPVIDPQTMWELENAPLVEELLDEGYPELDTTIEDDSIVVFDTTDFTEISWDIKEIVSAEEGNAFYDPEKCNNGGGYSQPQVDAIIIINDEEFLAYAEDTSCGELGYRRYLGIKRLITNPLKVSVGNQSFIVSEERYTALYDYNTMDDSCGYYEYFDIFEDIYFAIMHQALEVA